jgi:hypothetical protein
LGSGKTLTTETDLSRLLPTKEEGLGLDHEGKKKQSQYWWQSLVTSQGL